MVAVDVCVVDPVFVKVVVGVDVKLDEAETEPVVDAVEFTVDVCELAAVEVCVDIADDVTVDVADVVEDDDIVLVPVVETVDVRVDFTLAE